MKNKATALKDFIRKNRRAAIAVLLAIVGGVMIFLGTAAGNKETAERDELEAQLEEMCSSLSGVGSCRVMINYRVSEGRYGSSGTKTVESVAVICKGADRPGVRKELTDMLTSLYGIGSNRVHVSKMK